MKCSGAITIMEEVESQRAGDGGGEAHGGQHLWTRQDRYIPGLMTAVTACVRPAQTRPCCSTMEWEVSHEFLLLAGELPIVNGCCMGESQFSLRGCPFINQLTSRWSSRWSFSRWPHTQRCVMWASQTILIGLYKKIEDTDLGGAMGGQR